jgi:AraC family transcriptional regulator of adaptative response / DNA-3-methyladenine glycosylase II
VEDKRYRRSISCNGSPGHFEVSLDQEHHSLSVHVQVADPGFLYRIIERIRTMFDLNADWAVIAESLRAYPELSARMRAAPGLRVPGCWSGFELTTRAILGQQISVKGATTLAGRVAKSFGQQFFAGNGLTHLFPMPEVLADANLTNVGLPQRRADTIRAFARAVCEGQISFEGIIDSNAFLARLCNIPGIGAWTAQYVAMRALGEPDAFPPGDLGLIRALGLANSRELNKRAEAWRPWRAYACMYLWSAPNKSRGQHKEVLPATENRVSGLPIQRVAHRSSKSILATVSTTCTRQEN